jgi:hypothetical protein
LAIHPDYDLRLEIMQQMKERWFGLSPEGWHSLVVGLLRERQLELALEKLEQMHADNISVKPWLYDIFTYTLCELEEYDEAFKLYLYRRKHSSSGLGNAQFQYLLDKFSGVFHVSHHVSILLRFVVLMSFIVCRHQGNLELAGKFGYYRTF